MTTTTKISDSSNVRLQPGGLALAVPVLALTLWSQPAPAQDQPKEAELTSTVSRFMVTTGVNLRAAPETKAKSLGKFRRNDIVRALGKAKGTEWVAIEEDGKLIGYVYATALAPMIDGSLKRDLIGKLQAAGAPACQFKLRYQGRSEVRGERQRTADYETQFDCKLSGRKTEFSASMFITELPYQDNRRAIYQINVDLLGVEMEEEDVLSAISLFNFDQSRVTFDGLNDDSMGNGKKFEPKDAQTVPEALTRALEFAYAAWGDKVWKSLQPK